MNIFKNLILRGATSLTKFPTMEIIGSAMQKPNDLFPKLDLDLQQHLDKHVEQIKGELGSPFDTMGDLITSHKEVLINSLYTQGKRDQSLSKQVATQVYVAGSGNSLETAKERAKTISEANPNGKTIAIKGGSWPDNLHQLFGTGVGGTQQQRDTAYAMGLTDKQPSRFIAHSQGNLSVENVMQMVEQNSPSIRDTPVTGIGSPLLKPSGPKSTMVTGNLDPIRIARIFSAPLFGQLLPGKQKMVSGGHTSTNYLPQLPKDLLAPSKKTSNTIKE